jgi:mono/diheme cytochrome c family protein
MGAIVTRMKALVAIPVVKWSALALGSLVLIAVVVLYAGSEWRLARTYDAPAIALRDIGRPASVERGFHLSRIEGCQGCHQEAGRVFFDVPMVGRLIAPNLSRVMADYSDQELAALLRTGVKRDRTSAVVMPADSFAWLADEDVIDLIAWLRTLKPAPDAVNETTTWRPLGRFAMLLGDFNFSADLVKPASPPVHAPASPPTVRGAYLEKTLCSHCHRLDVENPVRPGTVAPALAPVAHGYDGDEFRILLRTGKGIGGRELGLMKEVAVEAFAVLDDADIAALHVYLRSVELTEAGAQ